MHRSAPFAVTALALGGTAAAQHDTTTIQPAPALQIAPASREGIDQIKSFQLAPGLACDLVAAEPDLCNPVARWPCLPRDSPAERRCSMRS